MGAEADALKASVHAGTPTLVHFDTLGRAFLTVAHNRFQQNGAVVEEKYPTRVELDIENNQRTVRDAGARGHRQENEHSRRTTRTGHPLMILLGR